MKRIIIIVLILVNACSNEEQLINNSITDIAFIMQRKENTLEVLDFKYNTIIPIELNTNIGKIDLMKKFRGKYYLINKDKQKIFVVENIDAPIINEIILSPKELIPSDICFPNATDGYITFANSPVVGIIDLTTNILSNIEIELPDVGTSIAGIGNQVYVTIPNKNIVVVIDTRTNTITEQIDIDSKPTLVNFSINGKYAIVIAIGDNKETGGNINEATPAKITIIDLATKTINRTNIITAKEQTAATLIPNAMIVTDNYIYVSAKNTTGGIGGYRIATSNYSTSFVMTKNECVNVIKNYNAALFIENSNYQEMNCILFNTNTNDVITTLNLGSVVNSCCQL